MTVTTTPRGYALDPAWHAERFRLDSLTAVYDERTLQLCDGPERVARACLALFSKHAYDPYYGRTLPRRLDGAGLIDVGAHAESVQVRADAARGLPQWELLVDQLAPGLLAHGLVDEADLARFHELWHDGSTVCFAPLMVSAWGRRPLESGALPTRRDSADDF
jgi:hypothetical protein